MEYWPVVCFASLRLRGRLSVVNAVHLLNAMEVIRYAVMALKQPSMPIRGRRESGDQKRSNMRSIMKTEAIISGIVGVKVQWC